MAETQPSDQQKAEAPLLPGFVKGAAIAGALAWVLSLLAILAPSSHNVSGEWVALLFLVMATLFLWLFVLPASIISWVRRS